MTPYEKTRQPRLNRASSPLIHFDHPVTQIAEMAGYESIYSFSTAFRK